MVSAVSAVSAVLNQVSEFLVNIVIDSVIAFCGIRIIESVTMLSKIFTSKKSAHSPKEKFSIDRVVDLSSDEADPKFLQL